MTDHPNPECPQNIGGHYSDRCDCDEFFRRDIKKLQATIAVYEEALSDIGENDAHYEAPFRIARLALERGKELKK